MSIYSKQIQALTPNQREALALGLRGLSGEAVKTIRSPALVAYARLKPYSSLSPEEIRRYLATKLPAHMIPRHITCLTEFPLMANGKIDRISLSEQPVSKPHIKTLQTAKTELEKCFVGIWKEVLQLAEVGTEDNFFELGGDSILAIQVVSRTLRKGYSLTPRQLFQNPSITELVNQIGSEASDIVDSASAATGNYEIVEGELPLSPIQRWFFERDLPEKNHFNQAFFFESVKLLNTNYLGIALKAILVHHDAFRLRFFNIDDAWVQTNSGTDRLDGGEVPFEVFNYSAMSVEEQETEIQSTTRQLQQGLNISSGKLICMAYFTLGDIQSDRLLIVVHHLAIDGVSWRIVLEDFLLAYQQISLGKQIYLPPKTTSYKQWAKDIYRLVRAGHLDQEVEYWSKQPYGEVVDLPVDFTVAINIEKDVETVSGTLDVATTHTLLKKVPASYGTQINEILMAALTLAFYRWKKLPAVLVELEHHGRELGSENSDLTRSVGWFTIAYPVVLQTVFANDLASTIKSTKEQLRKVPNKGAGYWLLRYGASSDALKSRMRQIPQASVSFNYLGQLDFLTAEGSYLEFSSQIPSHSYASSTPRPYLLEINSYVKGKQLVTTWRYNRNIHRGSNIESLCLHYNEALQDIIYHCVTPGSGGQTPSDFPGIQLDQDDLDEFLSGLD